MFHGIEAGNFSIQTSSRAGNKTVQPIFGERSLKSEPADIFVDGGTCELMNNVLFLAYDSRNVPMSSC